MDSLTGQFLIATTKMLDPRFMEAVILICSHDESGAMGLVVNHPLSQVSMAEVLDNFAVEVPDLDLPPVLLGGPVDMETGFFLHSSDYRFEPETGIMVTDSIFLSRSMGLLRDISMGQGPRHFLFMLGYAGWGPGQLEGELCGEGWLPLPAQTEDLFLTPPEQMWKKVTARYGIEITLYEDFTGNA